MKKEQVDLENAVVWIPDSKTPNGIAEVPLTPLAVEAFRARWPSRGRVRVSFRAIRTRADIRRPSRRSGSKTLRRAKVPYFRIYDLRSTYATRLSAGGVADEWVTQLLRQGDAQGLQEVFADEVADEARSAGQAEPPGQRKASKVDERMCTEGV